MRADLNTLRDPVATDLIVTNAAGSLRPEIPPGDQMLLSDHIKAMAPTGAAKLERILRRYVRDPA